MTLARLGGDEFILQVPNCNSEAISPLLTRIANVIKEPFTLFERTIRVLLSTGTSIYPGRGILLPAAFLPAPEETGLIIPVGARALQQACCQLHQWKFQGHTEWTLAINLPPTQFEQHDIVDIVSNALTQYKLSPTQLALELTESTALKNVKRSAEVLNAFSALVITISIDDFGTIYSNILMLKSLPARELNLDRIFVKDISENSKNTKIVSTIIDIAHAMNMCVVAEGIEPQDQETLLTQLGVRRTTRFPFGETTACTQNP